MGVRLVSDKLIVHEGRPDTFGAVTPAQHLQEFLLEIVRVLLNSRKGSSRINTCHALCGIFEMVSSTLGAYFQPLAAYGTIMRMLQICGHDGGHNHAYVADTPSQWRKCEVVVRRIRILHIT